MHRVCAIRITIYSAIYLLVFGVFPIPIDHATALAVQPASNELRADVSIGSGSTVTGYAQLDAIAALLAPDSSELPVQVALVFKNKGSEPIAIEIDPQSSVLVSTRSGEKYRVSSIEILMPDSTSFVQKSVEVVPFWIPPGSKIVFSMTAINLGKWDVVELRVRARGPVQAVKTVPSNTPWGYLPSITVDVGALMPPSSQFLRSLAR